MRFEVEIDVPQAGDDALTRDTRTALVNTLCDLHSDADNTVTEIQEHPK
jgi:hypothetical protein